MSPHFNIWFLFRIFSTGSLLISRELTLEKAPQAYRSMDEIKNAITEYCKSCGYFKSPVKL